ncbi:unnamed protein product [Rotaria sordida]|uniref:Uncharacterized protein n=1 Tax=Rotaria sordida TaxID=392033 RepID=A0A814SMT8_9BILA|nr:unnamed protein product [Rotaria sordida]CAF1060440.1 unnamed protein product [Rotaria sordida]CAF1150349.1 unnamed protein product [Rotaria sordida]
MLSSNHRCGQITTSTTETDVNSDGDKENRRKISRASTSNDKLNDKRRRRKNKNSNNHDYNDVQWSFSSDEEYQPPLIEQLYPSSMSSARDRADFELTRTGRIDYFCEKYLYLTGVIVIRKFIHEAQINLSMHQENFYEFLRFIRNSSTFLIEIQEIAEKIRKEDTKVKIEELVNVGYESK